MNAIIVYDSVFGNTEQIAQSIAVAFNASAVPISQVTAEKLLELDVLIVGSPTRAFRPTEAVAQLLNALPKNHLAGVRVAAFDTRIVLETIGSPVFRFMVDKGGYAANTLAKSLQKRGGKLVAPPAGFFVTGDKGPLQDGELERAAEWARQIQLAL